MSRLQWSAYINAIRGDLPALEVGHFFGWAMLYGDVAPSWQVGIQGCCWSCHKEGNAAITNPSFGTITTMIGQKRQQQQQQHLIYLAIMTMVCKVTGCECLYPVLCMLITACWLIAFQDAKTELLILDSWKICHGHNPKAECNEARYN